jgi:hypothetical protein
VQLIRLINTILTANNKSLDQLLALNPAYGKKALHDDFLVVVINTNMSVTGGKTGLYRPESVSELSTTWKCNSVNNTVTRMHYQQLHC